MKTCVPLRAHETASATGAAPRYPRDVKTTWTLCSLLVLAGCLAGCKEEPEPQKVTPPDRKIAIKDMPEHREAFEREDRSAGPKRSATGRLDLRVEGETRHFDFFPPGKNAAVHNEEAGVSRIMISAAEGDDGFPALDIVATGVRLDQLEFPATLERTADDADSLMVRLHLDDTKTWHTTGKGAEANPAELTLEAFEGQTLRGRFEATLQPRNPGIDSTKEVSGTFEVELRLRGVEEGTASPPNAAP